MVNDTHVVASTATQLQEQVDHKKQTQTSSRLSYLPGIDGLRAIAVLAVLFYHAEMVWMPGGFLGVEVFFAISGYLITGLLINEWRRDGYINLLRFWFRRARRLLPAVFALLIVVLAFTVIFLPGEVASLRFDALAAAAYVSNWYQILIHKSYFEAIGRPSLLRHLWSLAVEEQFYLVWPVLLVLILRFIVPRIKVNRRSLALALITLLIATASTLLMAWMYNPDVDPSRIYYGTDTRAGGFLIGAALAMLLAPGAGSSQPHARAGWLLDVLGFGALGGLVAIYVLVSEINPYLYLGGFAVVALLTAAAIVATSVNGSHLFTRFLSIPVIRWVGLRSYSIYLWHWPIFTVTRPQLDIPLDGLPLMLLRLVLTALCAELSYRYIEKPIREGAIGRLWARLRQAPPWWLRLQWSAFGFVTLIALITLGNAVVRAQPPAIPPELAESSDVAATPTTVHAIITVTPMATSLPAKVVATPVLTRTMAELSSTPKAAVVTSSQWVVTSVPTAILPTPTTTSNADITATLPVTNTSASITDVTTLTDVLGANYRLVAIGDSVMKGAAKELQDAMGNIDVDAVVSRQAGAALALLRQRKDAGTLGDCVILHIGNNAFVTPKQLDEIMQVLASVPRVIIVNLHVPRRWEEPNNLLIANAVKSSTNALLVDWHAATLDHPEWFADDGVHMQPGARKVYVSLILAQIKAPYLAQKTQQITQQQEAH